jgi:hypothetical protein
VRPAAAVAWTALATPRIDLAERVAACPLRTAPFHHVYIENAFAPDVYRRLLAALPDLRRYRELRHREAMLPDGRSARRKLYLYPEHVRLLPAPQRGFWLEMSRVLRSRELQEAFKAKFQEALERRFKKGVEHLTFYPVPMLLRDFPGYKIGIHGDSRSKAITVQFYLPPDESQAHLGTVLHEGRDEPGSLRTTRLAFRPASGYAFPVVRHASWHSVPQTRAGDGERNSLMLTYYVQEHTSEWLVQHLKRPWVFLASGLRR